MASMPDARVLAISLGFLGSLRRWLGAAARVSTVAVTVFAVTGCGAQDDSTGARLRQASVTATPTFIQGNFAVPSTPQTNVAVRFNAAQSAGNLNVVIVGWSDSVSHTVAVTDTSGNTYQLAVGPTLVGSGAGSAAA